MTDLSVIGIDSPGPTFPYKLPTWKGKHARKTGKCFLKLPGTRIGMGRAFPDSKVSQEHWS